MKKLISIIIPCYDEEESLALFYKELNKVSIDINDMDFEILFIDDGSKDNTLNIVKELKKLDERIHFISFSRNFGKESAMFAGLELSKGDYVAIMDADLQDPPYLLKDMLNKLLNNDIDCVASRRIDRKGEPKIRSFYSKLFYKLINCISSTEIVDGARDFRLMKRQMVDAIVHLKETSRFSKGIFSWVGFRTEWIEFENINRIKGNTKWSFSKLLLYSIDGIISFSSIPLTIVFVVGIISCISAFLAIIYFVLQKLIFGIDVEGWTLMMCVIIMIGGVQIFATGILGQYLAKIFLESKHRPIYIVKEKD